MAGISKETNKGRDYWRVSFRTKDGKPRSIRIGATTKEHAITVKTNIEKLLSCSKTGLAFDGMVSAWINSIPDKLRARLEDLELIPRMKVDESPDRIPLSEFCEVYIERRKTDCASSTVKKIKSSLNILRAFFEIRGCGDIAIQDITPIHGNEYRWSRLQDRSEATMAKDIKIAKQMLKEAKTSGHLDENPFEATKGGDDSNAENQHYFSTDDLKRIMSFCPNSDWRVIIALARLGGLRIPSELGELKWSNIDWESGRILIHAPKTKKKKPKRKILLFPEIRDVLLDHLEICGTSEHVISDSHLRNPDANLRTPFSRILEKAGVEKYPRLFNNMRSSFITDLLNSDDSKLSNIRNVAYLAGNSPKTILKHYAQMLGDKLDDALGSDPFSIGGNVTGNTSGNFWWEDSSIKQDDNSGPNYQETKKPRENGAFCRVVSKAVKSQVTPTGFEPVLPA